MGHRDYQKEDNGRQSTGCCGPLETGAFIYFRSLYLKVGRCKLCSEPESLKALLDSFLEKSLSLLLTMDKTLLHSKL